MAKPVSEIGVIFSMKLKPILFAAFTLPFWSCQPESGTDEKTKTAQTSSGNMKAFVENIRDLDAIPSGSGLVKTGENFYLISDDSPYFFKLGPDFKILEKNAIPNYQKSQDYRIPKARKPDYESACLGKINGQEYLLAFASGSKTPERDSLLIVNLNAPENGETYSLRAFYELIKTQAKLTDNDINIEGSAIINEDLFLFNRGKNVLVQTNWSRLLIFLKGGPNMLVPEIKTYRIKLPQIKGIDPGFSGACRLENDNKLLFTASVENTQNWIEDGEILGSFIGILNVDKLSTAPLENAALLSDKTGNAVIEKVESIEFLQREPNGKIKAICLTDDDQGGSKILDISLQQ